jgi:signal transduction histidine kinase
MAAGVYLLSSGTILEEVSGEQEATLRREIAHLEQRLAVLRSELEAMATLSPLPSIMRERATLGAAATRQEIARVIAEEKQTYGASFTETVVYDSLAVIIFPPEKTMEESWDTLASAVVSSGHTIMIARDAEPGARSPQLWLYTPIGDAQPYRQGVLAACLHSRVLIQPSTDHAIPPAGKACLVDLQKGTIVPLNGSGMRRPQAPPATAGLRALRAGRTGLQRYRDHQDREVIGAYAPLPLPGWGVLLEREIARDLAGLHRLHKHLLIMFGGLSVICIGAALLISRRILRRLEQRDRQAARRSEQLIAADKLATVGSMAASVAHEINNPLTTINVLIHNLFEESPPDEPQRMDLNIALDEIAKIKNIILRFLEFARPQEPEFSEVQVNDVVHRFCQLMRHQAAAKRISIVERLDDNLPPVVADPSQIDQAILNIMFNALEATPVQGTIELSTARAAHQSVSVRVFNTGPELEPELEKKIFEPFFSTKAQGTGLGLSIVRMIMDRHGGEVTAAAVPGQGTEFILTLSVENRGNGHGE